MRDQVGACAVKRCPFCARGMVEGVGDCMNCICPSIIASSTFFLVLLARTLAVYQRGAVDSDNDCSSSSKIITTPPPAPLHFCCTHTRHPRLFASNKSRHRALLCIIPSRPANQLARHGRLCIGFARPQRAFAQQHRPCWLDLPVLLSYHHCHSRSVRTVANDCLVCLSNDSFTTTHQHLHHPRAVQACVCTACCCHQSVAHSSHHTTPHCRAPLPLAEPNFPSLPPRFTTTTTTSLINSLLRHTPATRHLSCNTDSHALRHPLPPTHGVPFNRKSLLPSLLPADHQARPTRRPLPLHHHHHHHHRPPACFSTPLHAIKC